MSLPSTPARPAAGQVLLVSAAKSESALLSSSARKRRITPTAEQSSAKKLAIITFPGAVSLPAFLNPLKWSYPQAQIDAQLPFYTAPHPSPNPLWQGPSPRDPDNMPRHILLPFNLCENPSATGEHGNLDILRSIFPGNDSIAQDGVFLYFVQKAMPPKPWPKTVAGLPIFITPQMSLDHTPMQPLRLCKRGNSIIAEHIAGKDKRDWADLFHAVREYFQGLEIPITEVMHRGNFLHIVLERRDADRARLPYKAGNIPCYYLFEDEMGRPSSPQACRLSNPAPGNPDNSTYTTLRPGVRVTSAFFPPQADEFLSSTAGVLMQDQSGNAYVTVAAHGFPAKCGTAVMHPDPANGRAIGELIMELTHTDIAIVKLAASEKYSNTTFETTGVAAPRALNGFVGAKQVRVGTIVELDSPDTGNLGGTFMHTSYTRVPIDEAALPEQQWVFTTWCYMGQESAEDLPAGMCGTAMWTEEGEVFGFFRYAPQVGVMKDWCAGVAADEVMRRGFTMVDTGVEGA